MGGINGVALAVLVVLFLLVTVMGFLATRWRRPTSMESLDEWGLGHECSIESVPTRDEGLCEHPLLVGGKVVRRLGLA